ncbi:unnamed protein product [Ceutorhynchus assimilis]|uniref:Uncharacterized protein n=1 Tax=Ceutorhynchus assimilis TaxID=467358 RepID=A0A9N9MFN9_9CUCU|nr:unnamed protein product [Ceutorhynchus assimilis]
MPCLNMRLFDFIVECKKAQPKEVMLPANLAKTRAAGRGAYGELLVLNPAAAAAAAATSAVSALRYAPYPLPHGVATLPAATVHHAPSATLPLAAIAVAPATTPLHYATHTLYDVTGCFPAAAYAAYAAGRGYSGYPSFGLPYPTVMNNYQAAAAAQGFGPPASPHAAAAAAAQGAQRAFPAASSPGPALDMYNSSGAGPGDSVGYVQAASPQPSSFPAIAVSRAPLNYSPVSLKVENLRLKMLGRRMRIPLDLLLPPKNTQINKISNKFKEKNLIYAKIYKNNKFRIPAKIIELVGNVICHTNQIKRRYVKEPNQSFPIPLHFLIEEFNLQDNVEQSSDQCFDEEVIIENIPDNNNSIEFTTDNTNTEEMIDCQEHSANTVSSNKAVLKEYNSDSEVRRSGRLRRRPSYLKDFI